MVSNSMWYVLFMGQIFNIVKMLIFPQTLYSSVQSLGHVQHFATPWTAACQAFLSISNSQSLFKLMSIELVMLSNYLILPIDGMQSQWKYPTGFFKVEICKLTIVLIWKSKRVDTIANTTLKRRTKLKE